MQIEDRPTRSKQFLRLLNTTMQAIALNALNGGKTKTYDDLKDELNLEDGDIKPLMHSLSCGRHKVVNKTPVTKSTISSTDGFTANAKFTGNTRMIRILTPRNIAQCEEGRGGQKSRN